MKTLIIIHGADSFSSQESYISWLRENYVPRAIEPWEYSDRSEWKTEIAKKWIASGGKVYKPTMPNKQNAQYQDWKILLDALFASLDLSDEITLIGGSLGGCMILKYFSECSVIAKNEAIQVSENTEHGLFPLPSQGQARTSQGRNLPDSQIHQIHLVAACTDEGNFTAPENYDVLRDLGDRVHIWHAEDDNIVPFATAKFLEKTLPDAETHFFESERGYGHFHRVERFAELEEVLFG